MVLDTSSVLQIDATIITGVLILLTVSSFAGASQSNNDFVTNFRMISTLVIILPFSASAVFTLIGRMKQLYQLYRELNTVEQNILKKMKELESELKKLQDEQDKLVDRKSTNPHWERLEMKIINISNHMKQLEQQHKEAESDSLQYFDMDHPHPLSIILMISGFGLIVLLLSIIIVLELSRL